MCAYCRSLLSYPLARDALTRGWTHVQRIAGRDIPVSASLPDVNPSGLTDPPADLSLALYVIAAGLQLGHTQAAQARIERRRCLSTPLCAKTPFAWRACAFRLVAATRYTMCTL